MGEETAYKDLTPQELRKLAESTLSAPDLSSPDRNVRIGNVVDKDIHSRNPYLKHSMENPVKVREVATKLANDREFQTLETDTDYARIDLDKFKESLEEKYKDAPEQRNLAKMDVMIGTKFVEISAEDKHKLKELDRLANETDLRQQKYVEGKCREYGLAQSDSVFVTRALNYSNLARSGDFEHKQGQELKDGTTLQSPAIRTEPEAKGKALGE